MVAVRSLLRSEKTWIWAGAALVAAYYAFLGAGQTWAWAGDAYASYFPAAHGLLDGHGLGGLAPLHRGQARMPLFTLLVSLLGLVLPLMRAAQVVNVLSWAGAFALAGFGLAEVGWARAAPLVLVGLLASPVVARTAVDALPEASFALACTATLYVLARATRRSDERAMALVGLLCAATVQGRFNGVVLVVVVPAAVALWWPGSRGRALAWLGAGLVVGLTPTLVLSAYLESHGIAYPNFYFGQVNLPGGAELGASTILGLLASGLAEAAGRIASGGVPWPAQVAALATLAYAARRDVPARMVLVSLLALVGILIPLHHEARFHAPFAPVWLATAAVGLLYAIQRIPYPAVRRWAPAGVLVVAAVALLPPGIRTSLSERRDRVVASEEFTLACRRLAARAGAEPVALGLSPAEYNWSWLRGCHVLAGLPVWVVPVPGDAVGVPERVRFGDVDGGEPLLESAVTARARVVPDREQLRWQALDEPPPASAAGVETITLPHPARAGRCHTMSVPVRGGGGLWVDLWTPVDNGVDLRLEPVTGAARTLALTTGGRPRRIEILRDAPDGDLRATYCPLDPIIPGEPIRFRFVQPSDDQARAATRGP